jgi:hypothetical protein
MLSLTPGKLLFRSSLTFSVRSRKELNAITAPTSCISCHTNYKREGSAQATPRGTY